MMIRRSRVVPNLFKQILSRARVLASLLVGTFVFGSLSGCTLNFDFLRYLRARYELRQGEYQAAVQTLDRIRLNEPDSDRALVASRLGSKVALMEAKNYPAAIEFYRHLVLKSEDPKERIRAQARVAQIYFENIQDFDQAVIEFEKLLKMQLEPEEKVRYRMSLAKAHFQLNNLEQAQNELESIMALKLTPEQIFDVKILRANVAVVGKNLPAAAKMWEEVLRDFPERAYKEKVGMSLVVVYEELKEFSKAMTWLEAMKSHDPNPDFLENRILRLKELQLNQPGAQGLKR